MEQNLEEIEKIKAHNEKQGSLFDVWPLIFFIIGLVISALAFNHTLG